MIPCSLRLSLLLDMLGCLLAPPALAQVQVTPKESRGAKPLGEPGASDSRCPATVVPDVGPSLGTRLLVLVDLVAEMRT